MIATANEHRRSPFSGVISSASEVAGDFVELAELQLELVKADANDFATRSIPSIGGILACSVTLLVCLPVGLLGLADVLASQLGFDLGLTRLAIGATGGLLSLIVFAFCLTRLKAGLSSFSNSQKQLGQNLVWLKEMIRRQ